MMANVILSVAVGIRFPPASCTCTLIAGVIVAVAVVFVGSTLKTSCVGPPNVISKLVDVAVLKPPTVASSVWVEHGDLGELRHYSGSGHAVGL